MEFAYYRFFSPFPFNLGCLIKGSRRFCFTTNFRAVDSRWNPPRMKPTTRWKLHLQESIQRREGWDEFWKITSFVRFLQLCIDERHYFDCRIALQFQADHEFNGLGPWSEKTIILLIYNQDFQGTMFLFNGLQGLDLKVEIQSAIFGNTHRWCF